MLAKWVAESDSANSQPWRLNKMPITSPLTSFELTSKQSSTCDIISTPTAQSGLSLIVNCIPAITVFDS